MRDCVKNKQLIYVAHYLGKSEILTDEGFETGVYTKRYSRPIACKENVTSSHNPSKSVISDDFGIINAHSALIVTSEGSNYAEGDLFWINKKIGYLDNKDVDYSSANYTFGGRYFTLNTVIIGLNTFNEKV